MVWKKTIAAATLLAMPLGLAACAGSNDQNTDAAGNQLITANGTEPQNPLVPGNTNETAGVRFIDLLFTGLFSFDAQGNLVNEMAESLETSDQQFYRVKLKPDQVFTDGSPVTSESFVKAWNYVVEKEMLEMDFYSPIKGYAPGAPAMEGLKIVDDLEFTIELNYPSIEFPQRLAMPSFAPLPEVAYKDLAAFGNNPVGNGPYKLASWNHNEDAVVVPNPDYKGPQKVENDGLRFVFYPSLDAAYTDLLAGNLDVLDALPDSAVTSFQAELEERAILQPTAVFRSFTVSEYVDHFGGEEGRLRRRALSMAIDRQQIIDNIFGGTKKVARDFSAPVVPGFTGEIAGNEVLEYNPEKARELWAQADAISPFAGKVTIAYNSDGAHQGWVDAVTNQIRNTLGVDAAGEAYPDFKSLRDDVTNSRMKSGFRSGWTAAYPSLEIFLEPLYTSESRNNDAKYRNPAFDQALIDAGASATREEAYQKYNAAQAYLMSDLPAIPTWYDVAAGGYSEKVENVIFKWNSYPEYRSIKLK
ncbi:peptide ABC transporter substrate-binding protein [Corynebacterium caspium]|uniref:peptide ABC transporter substrate-binding protein n=1 Tax=Corynebacterium caspium TaxID=234828 RepID=UPI000369D17D|nr:ABC transporter substrate-binding protein [Corynebacterium caspium]WKD59532.1 Periplasmic murein peptide-binding protein precursor [Corynebacterium caspium DSM 44850]